MGCSFATEKVRQGALACARPRPHVTRETTEKAEGAMRWWVTLNRRRYEVPRSGLVQWMLYHHVFWRVHLAWFAPEFDTYKRTNPRSSNPWELYRAYYAAWFDQDHFEPYVAMKRQSLSAVI